MTGSDSAESKFEYPVLTKFLGTLNYPVLKTLKNELKANAASIISDLEGGQNVHLGLVLTDVEYAVVCATHPYVRHKQPSAPTFGTGTPQHEVIQLRQDYKEAKELFREMVMLEKLLLKMLSQAVPSMYLNKFCNKHSNALEKTIPEILDFLFTTYGKISEEKLLTEEQNLRVRVFEITDPMIVMYNEVDDLIELGIAAKNP